MALREIAEHSDLVKILRNIADISLTDIEVYRALIREYLSRQEPLTVTELANIIGKSRSTVERSLIKLLEVGLVERKVALSRSGGYTFVYYPKPIDEVKEKLLERLQTYYERARDLISKLDHIIMA